MVKLNGHEFNSEEPDQECIRCKLTFKRADAWKTMCRIWNWAEPKETGPTEKGPPIW